MIKADATYTLKVACDTRPRARAWIDAQSVSISRYGMSSWATIGLRL
jgi:hypothetical protein